jgi:transcriptional regulator with XRE-family HTH domain
VPLRYAKPASPSELGPYAFVHHISRESRRRIVMEALRYYDGRKAAKILGVSRSAVSLFERGKRTPSDRTVAKALILLADRDPARAKELLD